MADSKPVGSARNRNVREQSLAVQADEKDEKELTADVMDFKTKDSLGLRNACQEQPRMQEMVTEEEEEEDESDDSEEEEEQDEEEQSTDGEETENSEEVESVVCKRSEDEEEEEREEERNENYTKNTRHKESEEEEEEGEEEEGEDERAEIRKDDDSDKDDDDDDDDTEPSDKNDDYGKSDRHDDMDTDKNLTDLESDSDDAKDKIEERVAVVTSCRSMEDASKMAPGKDKMKLERGKGPRKLASGEDVRKLTQGKAASRKALSGKDTRKVTPDKNARKSAHGKDASQMAPSKDTCKATPDKDASKMDEGKRGRSGARRGVRKGVADSESDTCEAASITRSKGGSSVATPTGEGRAERETDPEGEDGTDARTTGDSEVEEDAEKDAAEGAENNDEDGDDAGDKEDGGGGEDDRVLVERDGKFSFLSVGDLTSQEKRLYGLISSAARPTLASKPKLKPPKKGQSDAKSSRLPLLGIKRDGVPAGAPRAVRSRAARRGTVSDSTVAQTSGKVSSKTDASVSTTAASVTTVAAAQSRRPAKTPSCPTVSLPDRRRPGLAWRPAGPPKAAQRDSLRPRWQEQKQPRGSKSASGVAQLQPGVEPGTVYRSPYAFSPERKRELSRRLKNRIEDERRAEEAKRLEEESRRKEAELAFSFWVDSKRRQSQDRGDQELNPRLSKKLIEATQREAAESAFNEWLRMKRRQRMEETQRREEDRERYLMALENAVEGRQRAERAYKGVFQLDASSSSTVPIDRWVKKKQKTCALLKRKRIGCAAAGASSSRHHVTARGQRMLAGATMRREPTQRPPRCLLRKKSPSAGQFPAEPLSLATASNYFRLLYCM